MPKVPEAVKVCDRQFTSLKVVSAMGYAIVGLFAFVVGGLLVFVLTERKRNDYNKRAADVAVDGARVKQERSEVVALRNANERELQEERDRLAQLAADLEGRTIAYSELEAENSNLKSIQIALAQNVRKNHLDIQKQDEVVANQAQRSKELGKRYLNENVKWIGKGIDANNYASSKQKLVTVIERCRSIGFEVSAEEESVLLDDLKSEFEKAVRSALEREEQARLKAQIREEQQREKEIQRELDRIQREKEAIEGALAVALAQARDEHDAEVASLRARLAEAEESQRAVSQAQLTKAGYVYVISNIGSFGEGVYKIGMTRRRTPLDRVRELGDASVPFPFDVHMMISANNAPQLEHTLHKAFQKMQVNRVNPRKEFFRVDLHEIADVVREHHGDIEYEADAEALQYRQSISMSDDDQEYIESVYDEFDDEVAENLSSDIREE